MENWGLITFRENALFYSEQTNSIVGKQNIALIVAYELAHFVNFKFYF
jgi:aminopeptidase N